MGASNMTIRIYELIGPDGKCQDEYFTSENEALDHAYEHLDIMHDYQVEIIARDLPASTFTTPSRCPECHDRSVLTALREGDTA